MRFLALIDQMGDIDQSWGGGLVLLWIFAETNLFVICGTLPTVRPMLNYIAPRIFGSTAGKSTAYTRDRGHGNSRSQAALRSGSKKATVGREYMRFDDDIMYPLETVVAVEGGDGSGSDGGDRHGGDNSSKTAILRGQPAIMQTKTATVTYTSQD
ncbi:hypothetical protein C7999DRAFT_33925 [Corynascus novoguineensis]|uniref:Uncharacterized protein n=1 Tax=Corynascus novoguineensis TaxID=1126955 RepID=A0AAN7CPV6_9PEZI|nr:hypothetical protein C7999DRAFT_33925 [Corynascus novoguineensis]